MRTKGGYILVELLISVQIILVIILFIVTVTMFNRTAIHGNEQRQAALYTLQSEMELFIANHIAETKNSDDLIGYDVYNKQKSIEELQLTIEIELSWRLIDTHLANIKGQVSWQDGSRQQVITLVTNQFIRSSEEVIDDEFINDE
ncbi:hypothetical protein [Desulfuribacillus alkaliarsenatis]|uniref:Uncharacterized protein n=1 Tax=Desulfuribacillus alkaliarsenatis TaxID=766136 RepID=A0A1E5G5E0_9FIRM|nr:hypothetical protein [Desulfuribacillus alkaliarsenatis]OEF98407.1 hypothetical protein BHF68_01640 [Desulfuribacillus alkaliarsenatis]